MSWGTIRTGSRDEVVKWIDGDFAGFANMYPTGTLEGDDVAAAKKRVDALLTSLDLTPVTYYENDLVTVEANGSHSWDKSKDAPCQASFTVKVARVLRPPKS